MSQMIEVKTAELSGATLRWAVALAEGLEVTIHPPAYGNGHLLTVNGRTEAYRPDMDLSQGGPLIDKFHADLHFDGRAWWAQADTVKGNAIAVRHEHPLTAVFRAIVAAELGDTVAVPAELLP